MNYKILILSLLVSCSTLIEKKALNDSERQILQIIDKNYEDSIKLLKQAVEINSGTNNLAGVKKVGDLFEREFKNIGFNTRWISMPQEMKRAGHLFAEHKGNKGKRLLLIGHLDTVFEPDSPFQTWTQKENKLYGPGTEDMKSGNIIILYALKALFEAKLLDQRQIIVALHGDEEDGGQPDEISRRDLIEVAKRSDYALGFEGATGPNYATIARRGFSSWDLEVTGKRAHSSGIFSKEVGSGAIFEASRILYEFYKEIPEQYLTFNPGIIGGGTTVDQNENNIIATGKSNIIAEIVKVKGDLRFISNEQKIRIREKMQKIVDKNLPLTNSKITFKDSMPSMPPTEGNYLLLNQLSQLSIDMGLGKVEAWDPGKRGAGDISYVSQYLSCIDGLGAMGEGSHSLNESLDLSTFKDLIKRAALFIYRLSLD